MNSNIDLIPIYRFFNILRTHRAFELGVEEYFSLIEVLQKDDSYFDSLDSMLILCQLLWLKPGQSELLFTNLFKQSFRQLKLIKKNESLEKNEENNFDTSEEDLNLDNNNNNNPEKEKSKPPEIEEQEVANFIEEKGNDIYLNIIKKANGKKMSIDNEDELLKRFDFKFSNHFPGINQRQIKHQWRFLNTPYAQGISDELDISATIHEYATNGFIQDFKRKKSKKNKAQILCLIDHRGSMVAFNKLADILFINTLNELKFEHQVFYFSTLPNLINRKKASLGYYVYENVSHTKHKNLLKVLQPFRFKEQDLSIIIFSDAGVGKRSNNSRQIDATYNLIQELKKVTSKIVWMNPFPTDRWENTSADMIKNFVFMCQANEDGIKTAVDIFRGKITFKEKTFHS